MNKRSAKNVLEFARVRAYDQSGRVTSVEVPGHEGRRYIVDILRRDGKIVTFCRRNPSGRECEGSKYSTCYHSVAAVMLAAQKTGLKTAVCETEEDARRASNLHRGKITKVETRPSGGEWYLVTWED